MEWYYANNGERSGPVSAGEMARLVADGTVNELTLVWRAGMAEWQPWSVVAETAGLPPPPLHSEAMSADGAGGEPVSEEPVLDPEGFWAGLKTHGFSTSPGAVLGRAWDLYRAGFGPCLGVTLLAYLIMIVAGVMPVIGLLASLVVSPQITAGLYWYFIRRLRGEPAEVSNLFEGYTRCMGRLLLVALVQLAISIVFAAVMLAAMGVAGISTSGGFDPESPPQFSPGAFAVLFLAVMALIYVMLRFAMAPILVMDRDYAVVDAIKLSWRMVGLRFWTFLGVMGAILLLCLAGALALLIGLLLVAPMYPAVMAYFYEDAWRSARGLPPAGSA